MRKRSMSKRKIGLLLINHGSRSETWRNALTDLEARVRGAILAGGIIEETKTAFMEYTEPSIATRMKEFDAEGFTDVVIVPIFLTISSHSFEDIPTILGQKNDAQVIEELESEKIERYTPKARIHIAPLLDFSNTLPQNVLRRSRELSRNPENEGLVLISEHSYGWCGHIVHYDHTETTKAINAVLEKKDAAIVIPVLVAYDEMFQKTIIGRGIAQVENNQEKVLYSADSILPDTDIENWVIDISAKYAGQIANL
ncbi:MAG: hypothetical protein B6D40_04560 [Anaerolineae bacterium UTCFX3]|nr:MAG: hypothetical protein B6D40_04560 [Anaerolineae bacterium UTCFX3]